MSDAESNISEPRDSERVTLVWAAPGVAYGAPMFGFYGRVCDVLDRISAGDGIDETAEDFAVNPVHVRALVEAVPKSWKSTEDYKPPRTKMGWERLERELSQANDRIVHYLGRTKDQEDEIERLHKIEAAARLLTASAGFRPEVKSPFGPATAIVLRDRFDALGEALDA